MDAAAPPPSNEQLPRRASLLPLPSDVWPTRALWLPVDLRLRSLGLFAWRIDTSTGGEEEERWLHDRIRPQPHEQAPPLLHPARAMGRCLCSSLWVSVCVEDGERSFDLMTNRSSILLSARMDLEAFVLELLLEMKQNIKPTKIEENIKIKSRSSDLVAPRPPCLRSPRLAALPSRGRHPASCCALAALAVALRLYLTCQTPGLAARPRWPRPASRAMMLEQ